MRLPFKLVIVLLFCFFFSKVQGQHNTLWFNLLDKKQGLSSNNIITGVLQDSEGYIWITTFDAGLNKYDGISVNHFRTNPNDTISIESDQLYGNLFEDRNKNIWFCSDKSIECYLRKSNQFKHYQISADSNESIDTYKGCFFLERDTFLWGHIGTDNTLFRFNIHNPRDQKKVGNTSYDIDLIPGLGLNGEMKYIFSIDGSKSTGLELFLLDKYGNIQKKSRHFHQQDTFLTLNIHSVNYKNENEVLLSTSQGIFFWDLKKKPILISQKSVPFHHSISLDSSAFLIKEANNGFKIYNSENKSYTPTNAFLTQKLDLTVTNTLKKPFLYDDKTLWMEFQKSGLVFCNPYKSKFNYLPKTKILQKNQNYNYRTILEDNKKNIWYTTYPTGLIQCNNDGQPIKYLTKNDSLSYLPSEQVFDLYQDSKNNLWAGTTNGLALYNPTVKKFKIISDENKFTISYVEKLLSLSDSTLLSVSYTEGIFRVEQKSTRWVMHPLPNFENKKGYYTIYEDNLNQIYLGFDDKRVEIYRWFNDTLHLEKMINNIGILNSFHEDKNDKTLWIASSKGLIKLNKKNLDKPHYIFNQAHGLIDNSIQSMAVDKIGYFWLGTKNGLSRFNPVDTTFRYFTKSDGAISDEFHEKSVLVRKNGSIWFGGNNGITIIDEPENITFSQEPAKVQITDFKINDETPFASEDTCFVSGASNISQIQYLKLPHSKNTLSFNFVAIDYSDPKSTQLKYILEPYDKNWVQLDRGQPGFSRYSNLPSGDYTLKIKGANSDGYWHPESIKELKITIIPRLIERGWFQSLLALLFALITWGIYKYRVNQIQEKAKLKTRAAENKMAALRAQMNPHFAFNSLQSINGFIANDDKLGAIEYVSQFSDLMRMMLENSRQNKISLEKEIDLLKIYVEVEALRFSQPFDYEFIIEENIDTFDVQVPSMLLQPFIENAIKHGLFHKKDKGNLLIQFSKKENLLFCSIEDNGIGRTASQKINTQKGRRHKSRGLEIIKERLEILRQSGFGNVNYQIKDLYDADKRSLGTRVEIMLPL